MLLAWRGAVDGALPGGIVSLAGWDFHPLVLIYAASGSLMISKTIHIPKP
jgi:CDP-diacylglycerol---serine O-phosphatidyltransferase